MRADGSSSEPGLLIGELAELAGTTARSIRHYHSIGLLAEPRRDDSGYRRYGAAHLVRLVRIRRLRAVGMPLEQIAAHLPGGTDEHADLQTSLRALAEDITRQIEGLQALRQKVLDLASRQGTEPTGVWQAALRTHGLLAGDATLPSAEHPAVDLLDALHPSGIEGVIGQSSALLSDPALARKWRPLLKRFQELTDDDSAIEELASEAAELLPRPEHAAPPVDVEMMERLLGGRFTSAQRRFLRRLRQQIEDRDT